MGAFVISPLPPVLLESLQTAGPLRSADVTPLPRYYRPSRIPLAVHRLPGVAGYTVSLLRRFLDGTRRVSPVARHDLVTVLSLPTPPKCFAASVLATLHAAFAREVRARPSGFSTFEALWVYLRCWDRTRVRQLIGEGLPFLPFSVARRVHNSTMATFREAPPIMPDGRVSQVRFEALAFRP
jgi:hypothetical protein